MTTESLINDKITNFPLCQSCSTNDLGVKGSNSIWVVVKKTGKTKMGSIRYLGYPTGGLANITGFQVEILSDLKIALCTNCLEEFSRIESETRLTKFHEEEVQHEIKAKKIKLIWRWIFPFSFLITIVSLFQLYKLGWPESSITGAVSIFAGGLSFFALLFSFFHDKLKKPEEPSLQNIWNEAHYNLVNSITRVSEYLKSTKILLGDDNSEIDTGEMFIISRNRYENDQFDGFALFHLNKKMEALGGPNNVKMEMYELREYATKGGRNAGKWICEYSNNA